MHGPNQMKRQFIKRWARGLKVYRNRNKNMSLLERKNAIKLTADVAMASTKLYTTHWSRALISKASTSNGCSDDTSKVVVQHMLSDTITKNVRYCPVNLKKYSSSATLIGNYNKKVRSKKILRKSCAIARVRKPENPLASEIAKRIVKRRTQELKSLVPGGELMDDALIIKEALDYVVSLQLQVNLMRQLVKITEL